MTPKRTVEADPADGSLVYTDADDGSPLKLTQRFRADGNVLDWTLELEAAADRPVRIGDLAIPLP